MTANPWTDLPLAPPFVLAGDKTKVETFNAKAGPTRSLRVNDLLPEPFIGNPKAPVLLLSNNPGFGTGWTGRATPEFQDRIRANLAHQPSAYPFYYLATDVQGPNRQWWEKRVKWLIERFSREVVAKSILNVVYFPYPSLGYAHDRLVLESQQYGFQLVREAMQRDAFIVFMRKPDRWLAVIKGLSQYRRKCQVNNTQNPTVSPTNLCDYQAVVDAIDAATRSNPP
jgi:hypothetical protein